VAADAIPAKGVATWVEARDEFFWKRVHAHPAVKDALHFSLKFCALRKQKAVLFVELGLQSFGELAAGIGWVACVCPWGRGRAVLRLFWSVDSIMICINVDEGTEAVPEDHDFGLNDGRKSQSGERSIGVMGEESEDPARSNLRSDWRNVKAIMVIEYKDQQFGGGANGLA
jgi:hypothetical protein